jgi:hypothetical protein
MAIIKCDDVGIDAIISTGSFEATVVTTEEYVEQNKVSLGKTLLAVESGFFLSDTLSPVISKANVNLLETRPPDVADTFRADSNRYWTLDENGNMKYMNANIYGFVGNKNRASPPPTFILAPGAATVIESTPLGLDCVEVKYAIIANAGDDVFDAALWKAFVDGAEGAGGSSYIDRDGNSFSRPSPLIPTGSTFTDHAFTMNTPFSKKELEMFANIDGHVDVADVESDYDFFAKAYEEGIASTTVPENALPHLYTEVQRGESEAENTIVSVTTTQENQVEEGYFRQWINNVLSSPDEMNDITKRYENVAILDSVIDERHIIDSTREDIDSGKSKSTSAFEILMAYANRENLFPMNVNIEVNTESASDLMFKAEEVGMVDDIVKMLMSDGDVTPSQPDPDTADGEPDGGTEDIPAPEVDLIEYTESDVKDALEEAFDSLESNEYRSLGDVLVPYGKLGRVMGTADSAVRTDFLTYYTDLMNIEQDADKKQNMVYVGEILVVYGDILFNLPYWRTS